jgi:hypothetical protein
MTELNSCKKDQITHRAENSCYLAFYRSLLSLGYRLACFFLLIYIPGMFMDYFLLCIIGIYCMYFSETSSLVLRIIPWQDILLIYIL